MNEAGITSEQSDHLLSLSIKQSEKIAPIIEAQATNPPGMPRLLISRLERMTNRDLITAMLHYETPIMTKKGMLSRSIELGKGLDEKWLDKHFAEETRGYVVQAKTQEGKGGYKLSEQGIIKTELRMKELIEDSGNGSKESEGN